MPAKYVYLFIYLFSFNLKHSTAQAWYNKQKGINCLFQSFLFKWV